MHHKRWAFECRWAWDYDEGAFRALAAAWLELNRAAVNRSLSTVGEQA